MIAKLDPTKGYLWFYVDHLGSTRFVDGGSTTMRRDYYPYGHDYLAVGNESAYQFTEKELDSVTGLYYFGARYYDREIGRWLVPDPLAEKYPWLSPYVYAANNPLAFIDPDGMDIGLSMNSRSIQEFLALPPPPPPPLPWNDQLASYFYGYASDVMRNYIPLLSEFNAGVWTSLGNLVASESSANTRAYSGVMLALTYIPIGPKGIASVGSTGVAAAETRAIVIGEGMAAVKAATYELRAQGINARWYQAWRKNLPTNRLMTPAELSAALARNARWLESKINAGYVIYDLGIFV